MLAPLGGLWTNGLVVSLENLQVTIISFIEENVFKCMLGERITADPTC